MRVQFVVCGLRCMLFEICVGKSGCAFIPGCVSLRLQVCLCCARRMISTQLQILVLNRRKNVECSRKGRDFSGDWDLPRNHENDRLLRRNAFVDSAAVY